MGGIAIAMLLSTMIIRATMNANSMSYFEGIVFLILAASCAMLILRGI